MRLLQKSKQYLRSRLPWLFSTPRAAFPKKLAGGGDAGLRKQTTNLNRKFALSGNFAPQFTRNGRTFYAYIIQFTTGDGPLEIMIYGVSDYHVTCLVDDMRNSDVIGGRIIQRLEG